MIVRTIIYYSQARNKCVRNAMQTLKYLYPNSEIFLAVLPLKFLGGLFPEVW